MLLFKKAERSLACGAKFVEGIEGGAVSRPEAVYERAKKRGPLGPLFDDSMNQALLSSTNLGRSVTCFRLVLTTRNAFEAKGIVAISVGLAGSVFSHGIVNH